MRGCASAALAIAAAGCASAGRPEPAPHLLVAPALRQPSVGFYQELSWAPDGSALLVSVLETTDDPEGFRYRVQRLDLDPVSIATLTSGPMDLWTSWSPDGARIAFASRSEDGSDVCVMDAEGGGRTRLTSDPADDTQPAWSPDGRRIAFVSRRGGADRIYVMEADGSGPRRLGEAEGDAQTPSWSPRGDRIAYFETSADGRNHVVVMNADGTGRRRLAMGVWPSWSPDGERILLGAPEGLTLMDPDGGGRVVLVPHAEFGEFSPDGNRIACIVTEAGFVSILLTKADGTEPRCLITRPAPSW